MKIVKIDKIVKIEANETISDFNYFKNDENYVLSSHGQDDGRKFTIPDNINIVLYEELGKEISCKNSMPESICNYTFDFSKDEKFKKALIYKNQLFPNLFFWPLRSRSNYVDYPSEVEYCGKPNWKINIDRDYKYGTNLQEIVEIIKRKMTDKDKIFIHLLACTSKGIPSVFASAKKYKNKRIRNKTRRNKTRTNKTSRNKKCKNKTNRNKKNN